MKTSKITIPEKLFFRIGEVAELLGVKSYVLRYWESEFPIVSPQKSAAGQRVYRRSDVELLVVIQQLLYVEKYSIEGARKRVGQLRKEGALKSAARESTLAGSQPGLRTENFARLREQTRELQQLARTPLSGLFRL